MRTGRAVTTRADGACTALDVEIAETDAEKAIGLSGRAALLPGWGMAFPFAPARLVGMTMAGVYFPLDMIFVDEGARVVWIEEATPYAEPRAPLWPVALVVEAPGGWARAVGLAVGDWVQLWPS